MGLAIDQPNDEYLEMETDLLPRLMDFFKIYRNILLNLTVRNRVMEEGDEKEDGVLYELSENFEMMSNLKVCIDNKTNYNAHTFKTCGIVNFIEEMRNLDVRIQNHE